MSSVSTNRPAAPGSQKPSPAALAKRKWGLIAVACLLLTASGSARYWRGAQFTQIREQGEVAPFPLKNLPTVVGSWRSLEGVETTLDPEIARVAGSSDHILRTYVNDETGDRATVLVLYGLAQLVYGHTAEVCYPAAGFVNLVPPLDEPIPLKDGTSVPFREAVYGRSQAGLAAYHEVYYSLRNAGRWRTEMASRWKQFRYNPGMFKIQVERRVNSTELDDSSSRDLMAGLVEAIEERMAESSTAVAAAK